MQPNAGHFKIACITKTTDFCSSTKPDLVSSTSPKDFWPYFFSIVAFSIIKLTWNELISSAICREKDTKPSCLVPRDLHGWKQRMCFHFLFLPLTLNRYLCSREWSSISLVVQSLIQMGLASGANEMTLGFIKSPSGIFSFWGAVKSSQLTNDTFPHRYSKLDRVAAIKPLPYFQLPELLIKQDPSLARRSCKSQWVPAEKALNS